MGLAEMTHEISLKERLGSVTPVYPLFAVNGIIFLTVFFV
jgi:hypothetical protein